MKTTSSRRDFLCCMGAGAAAFAAARYSGDIERPASKASADKPNILLIVSDDQGWGDASCNWKSTDVETPVMDEIEDADLELYDLQSDIGESRNLRGRHPEQRQALKEELIDFFRNIK